MDTPPTSRYRALDIVLMAVMALVLVLSAVWSLFVTQFVLRSQEMFSELGVALPVITRWAIALVRLPVLPLVSLLFTLGGFATLVLVKDRVRGMLAALACAILNGALGLIIVACVYLAMSSIIHSLGAP